MLKLALFFEGTGQGVHGNRTNVSLAYDACVAAGEAEAHLENGPGAKVGTWLFGGVGGVGWRTIFARARRWFEASYRSGETEVYLFGFSRGALLARHFAAWLDKLGVRVEYLGLWDTVDATPDLEVDEVCPANVRFARHAVAEHESRRFFRYVPLKANAKPLVRPRRPGASQVEEELFPGCHSDVGGFYEDNHVLADLARSWILAGALEGGLAFSEVVEEASAPQKFTRRLRHDSRRLVSNCFGLFGSPKREFPAELRRHRYRAVVSLGSNLEPRADYLKKALLELGKMPGTGMVRASSVIETEGVEVPEEYKELKFLNQVAIFATELDPYEFSDRMHAIETALGRVRTVRNGPRTIDIDLIDFDGLRLDDPELTLPHPRAHLRDFVMRPLQELAWRMRDGKS